MKQMWFIIHLFQIVIHVYHNKNLTSLKRVFKQNWITRVHIGMRIHSFFKSQFVLLSEFRFYEQKNPAPAEDTGFVTISFRY